MELAVVILVVATLGTLVFFVLRDTRRLAWGMNCMNNQKSLGVSYRLWAQDHFDLMPFQESTNFGGWSELLTKTNAGQYCWTNFAIMRDFLGDSPKFTVCPADKRKPAANFIVKGTTNDTGNAALKDNTTVSYFVGVTSSDLYPQSILGGDRNLDPGLIPDANYGFSPSDGRGNDVTLYTNSPVCWSLKMHSHGNLAGFGNILLGDGSGQELTSLSFRSDWIVNASTGTNFTGTNQPGFRLIFP